jgi:hypothetical protein
MYLGADMSERSSGPATNPNGRPGTVEDGLQVRRRSELLRRLGFQQSQVVDPGTGRPAWMWVRVWRRLRDAVIANGDGALAYRVWDVDFDPHTPFVLEQDITLWCTNGSFLDVSAQLLALAEPEEFSDSGRWERRGVVDHHPVA